LILAILKQADYDLEEARKSSASELGKIENVAA